MGHFQALLPGEKQCSNLGVSRLLGIERGPKITSIYHIGLNIHYITKNKCRSQVFLCKIVIFNYIRPIEIISWPKRQLN